VKRWLVVLALVAGCHRAAPTQSARMVVDGTGRQVALPAEVKRAVSLAASSTEIVFALGAGDRLVGVDRFSDFPPAAASIPRVGAEVDPNLERILALKPDVVFTATTANGASTVASLERLHVPVFVSRAYTVAEIWTDIEKIGDVLGRGPQARALTAQLRGRLDRVHARAAGQPPVPSAVVVWPQPLVVATRATFVSELLQAAGGQNVVAEEAAPFPAYSTERLAASAPAVIIIGSHATATPPLDSLRKLTAVPAVRDNRLYPVDGDLLFRPGPRIVDGAETLFDLLHPGAGK
jgi:iron complex transport system substrate-binding protein